MLIEPLTCPNCGAPFNWKQGQSMSVCVYCNTHLRITADPGKDLKWTRCRKSPRR